MNVISTNILNGDGIALGLALDSEAESLRSQASQGVGLILHTLNQHVVDLRVDSVGPTNLRYPSRDISNNHPSPKPNLISDFPLFEHER